MIQVGEGPQSHNSLPCTDGEKVWASKELITCRPRQGHSRVTPGPGRFRAGGNTKAHLEQLNYICGICSEASLMSEASPEPAIIPSSNLASLSGHQGQIRGEGLFMRLNHLTK